MISIIIPVFNAEKTIEILVNNISKTLAKNFDFENADEYMPSYSKKTEEFVETKEKKSSKWSKYL